MENLIDLLLNNPFLILLLLGGLFSLFRGKTDQDKEEDRRQTPPQQRSEPQKPRKRPESISDTIKKTMESLEQEVRKREPVQEKPVQTMSVEEHRKEQLQRLSNRLVRNSEMETETKSNSFAPSDGEISDKNIAIKSSHPFKENFKQNLTHEGLMQSVIMAEVLGLPRSKRPYQSVVVSRRKK